MSIEERGYLRSIASPKRRSQFLSGRLLARRMLCRELGGGMEDWGLSAQSGVKPVVQGRPDIHISISHSAGRVICGLSDRPLGVDIETVKPGRDVRALGALVCHPRELERMDAWADDEREFRFTQLWTLKEAWVKRAGMGIDLARMRAIFAKVCAADDKPDAVTLRCREPGMEQVVAVVSGRVHALRMAGEWDGLERWTLPVPG